MLGSRAAYGTQRYSDAWTAHAIRFSGYTVSSWGWNGQLLCPETVVGMNLEVLGDLHVELTLGLGLLEDFIVDRFMKGSLPIFPKSKSI